MYVLFIICSFEHVRSKETREKKKRETNARDYNRVPIVLTNSKFPINKIESMDSIFLSLT